MTEVASVKYQAYEANNWILTSAIEMTHRLFRHVKANRKDIGARAKAYPFTDEKYKRGARFTRADEMISWNSE